MHERYIQRIIERDLQKVAQLLVDKVLELQASGCDGEVLVFAEGMYLPRAAKSKNEVGSLSLKEPLTKILDLGEDGKMNFGRGTQGGTYGEGEFLERTFMPSRRFSDIYLVEEWQGNVAMNLGGKLSLVVTEDPEDFSVKLNRRLARLREKDNTPDPTIVEE